MQASRMTSSRPTAPSYTGGAVLVHWLLAAALFVQLALGWWMLDLPKSPPGLRAGWFNLHKSIGLTIALVVVLRLLWRAARPVAPDTHLPRWQRVAARVNHALLLACLLVIGASGLLGSNFTKYPVLYFGMRLPGWNQDWPAAKQLMSGIHYGAVWLLMGLIAVHVSAAFWHWLRRDSVCARMSLPPFSNLTRS
jgi:cytochrome b561